MQSHAADVSQHECITDAVTRSIICKDQFTSLLHHKLSPAVSGTHAQRDVRVKDKSTLMAGFFKVVGHTPIFLLLKALESAIHNGLYLGHEFCAPTPFRVFVRGQSNRNRDSLEVTREKSGGGHRSRLAHGIILTRTVPVEQLAALVTVCQAVLSLHAGLARYPGQP